MKLFLGLAIVFALFQGTAAALDSNYGEAGLLIGVLVVAATLGWERLFFRDSRDSFPAAARFLGLGAPAPRGVVTAASVSILLVLVIPLYARLTGASAELRPGWLGFLPGLFAQAGIAEEILFRGYLFGHLRQGRSFWKAAALSTVPFALVHLYLFFTLDWPVALASVLLAIVLAFPLAHLFELDGGTIWSPALVHFVVQSALKVTVVEGGPGTLPLLWIAACGVLPYLVFLVPRPQEA